MSELPAAPFGGRQADPLARVRELRDRLLAEHAQPEEPTVDEGGQDGETPA